MLLRMRESLTTTAVDSTSSRVADHDLDRLADEYAEFSAPFKARVGLDCPTFVQYLSWHRQKEVERMRKPAWRR